MGVRSSKNQLGANSAITKTVPPFASIPETPNPAALGQIFLCGKEEKNYLEEEGEEKQKQNNNNLGEIFFGRKQKGKRDGDTHPVAGKAEEGVEGRNAH